MYDVLSAKYKNPYDAAEPVGQSKLNRERRRQGKVSSLEITTQWLRLREGIRKSQAEGTTDAYAQKCQRLVCSGNHVYFDLLEIRNKEGEVAEMRPHEPGQPVDTVSWCQWEVIKEPSPGKWRDQICTLRGHGGHCMEAT